MCSLTQIAKYLRTLHARNRIIIIPALVNLRTPSVVKGAARTMKHTSIQGSPITEAQFRIISQCCAKDVELTMQQLNCQESLVEVSQTLLNSCAIALVHVC